MDMKKIKLLFGSVLMVGLTLSSNAQLTNDGLLTIESGATLTVTGDFTNNASGVVVNDGSIEVAGDFDNNGNFQYFENGTSHQGSILLNGSSAQTFHGGMDTTFNITIDNSSGVSGAAMFVEGNLALTDGIWDIGNTDVRFTANGTRTGGSSSSYFNTSGTGVVLKAFGTAGTFDYEIGTSTYYAPVGFSVPGANEVSMSAGDNVHDNPETQASQVSSDAVDVTWKATLTSSSSGTTITTEHPGTAELTGFDRNSSNHILWENGVSTNWSSKKGTSSGTDPYFTQSSDNELNAGTYFIGIDDAAFTNMDVSFFLEGPFSGGSMNTGLSAGGSSSILGTLSTSQPFTGSPWSYAGTESVAASFFDTHTDVVDWVLIELRDQSTPATILHRAACFVKDDGTLLDINGEDGVFIDAAPGTYHVSVRHRNHGSILTGTAISFSSKSDPKGSWDTRTSNANIHAANSLKASGANFVMLAGDANADNDINASDNGVWLADNGGVGIYSISDYDMNSDVNANDNAIWLGNNGTIISFP